MLQVKSEITKELADCTICPGLVMNDGTRIGAIADVDLFAAFTVDMEDAIKVINRKEGLNIRPVRGDLWTVEKRRESRYDATVEKHTTSWRIGVDELRRRADAGLPLFGEDE